jgi:hypothetical protein
MNAYNDIYPRLLDTLKTGAEKVSLLANILWSDLISLCD